MVVTKDVMPHLAVDPLSVVVPVAARRRLSRVRWALPFIKPGAEQPRRRAEAGARARGRAIAAGNDWESSEAAALLPWLYLSTGRFGVESRSAALQKVPESSRPCHAPGRCSPPPSPRVIRGERERERTRRERGQREQRSALRRTAS
jgi:hypothetical protein